MLERLLKVMEFFYPDRLEREWNLMGTGPIATLDNGKEGNAKKLINYKSRVLIPYIWDNQQVSFDTRDITNKSPYKYLACPKAREVIPHKDILYGNQEQWGNKGICVEGTTDVWRLGGKAFATSGIKFTTSQVRAISKTFKRVFIIFDGEESEAIKQARKLKRELEFQWVKAFIEKIKGDPGSMKEDDAKHLVKTLLK
jgi:DNA primase